MDVPAAPEPAATAPQAVDAYDLGDTDLSLRTPAEPEKPVQPRNEKGQFEPIVTPQAPADLPASKHPNYLVEQATHFGMTSEEIEDLSTAQLGRAVTTHLKSQNKLRSELAAERTVAQAAVKQPEPTPPTPPTEEDIDLGLGEFESELDPRLVGTLKTLAKKNRSLEAELAQERQRRAMNESRGAASVIDKAFTELGAAWTRLLGDKPAAEMDAKQPEFRRRVAILNEMGVKDIGQEVRTNRATLGKRIKAAAELLYGPQSEPVAEPTVKGYAATNRITPDQWNEGTVARPTARTGAPEPNGEAKAIANLSAKLREVAASEGGDSDVIDGLLG